MSQALDHFDFRGAVDAIVTIGNEGNRYVEAARPWSSQRQSGLARVLAPWTVSWVSYWSHAASLRSACAPSCPMPVNGLPHNAANLEKGCFRQARFSLAWNWAAPCSASDLAALPAPVEALHECLPEMLLTRVPKQANKPQVAGRGHASAATLPEARGLNGCWPASRG